MTSPHPTAEQIERRERAVKMLLAIDGSNGHRVDVAEQYLAAEHAMALEQAAAHPIDEYHDDMGDVLWWKFPITEPPYVGLPLDLGHTVEISVAAYGVDKLMRVNVGGWPGYHTHWTPLSAPPALIPASPEKDNV